MQGHSWDYRSFCRIGLGSSGDTIWCSLLCISNLIYCSRNRKKHDCHLIPGIHIKNWDFCRILLLQCSRHRDRLLWINVFFFFPQTRETFSKNLLKFPLNVHKRSEAIFFINKARESINLIITLKKAWSQDTYIYYTNKITQSLIHFLNQLVEGPVLSLWLCDSCSHIVKICIWLWQCRIRCLKRLHNCTNSAI